MMRHAACLALLILATSTLSLNAQDSPVLAKTTEKLGTAEAKAIRKAIVSEGPSHASPSFERPYPRVLIIPKDVKSAYEKKPQATVRLLLKIVEGGEPWPSIHASACINALVSSPEQGWMATHVDYKTWDDSIREGGETLRESYYDVCVRIIAEKEKKQANK
jgi:hypothetical protein